MVRGAFGRATPWLLLALPLLLLFLFLLLPYLLTFFYSTTGATIGRLFNVKEVGLKNFQAVFSEDAPSFISVVAVTAIFTAGTLFGSLALGTGLALALHTVSAGVRSALLAIYLIPWVIAAVIIGYTWRLIYDPAIGLANSVLGMVGIGPLDWLTEQGIALAALVVANVWAGYGIVLLVVSGALANVPPNIILAGQVDGASYARIVRRVILPAIRPTFLLAALVALVSGLNTFDLIYAMTRGGPLYHTETMALEMYRLTALKGNVGQGAAVTVILFTISLALAVAYVIIWRRETRKWS
ncbi:MAG: sugar ABC transporter permease [Chloroflexi bacterium]|nr:MAG: sugar ABC transporter permease [Chloroflexota bacterium]